MPVPLDECAASSSATIEIIQFSLETPAARGACAAALDASDRVPQQRIA